MTEHNRREASIVEEMESNRDSSLDLAAARLAVDVCALLEKALDASGLQAKEVAEYLGVTEGRVSQVLNGDGNVRIATLARFLHAMGYRPSLAAESTLTSQLIEARPRKQRAKSERGRRSGGDKVHSVFTAKTEIPYADEEGVGKAAVEVTITSDVPFDKLWIDQVGYPRDTRVIEPTVAVA